MAQSYEWDDIVAVLRKAKQRAMLRRQQELARADSDGLHRHLRLRLQQRSRQRMKYIRPERTF